MKYSLVLSGQGSEKVGMLKDVINENREANVLVKMVSELLNVDFFSVIEANDQSVVSDPRYNQILIFLYHNIFSRVIIDAIGYLPEFIMGHSLGQLCSYSVANVLPMDEMLRFLVIRTEIINDKSICPAARFLNCFGLTYEETETIIKENNLESKVEIALHNQKNNVVLAVTDEVRDIVNEISSKQKFIVKNMTVARPYHTSFMEQYNKKLLPYIDNLQFKNGEIPILLNNSCKLTNIAEEIKAETKVQMIKPVYWYKSLKKASCNNYIVLDPTGSQAKILRRIVQSNVVEIINKSSLKNINKMLIKK